MKFIPSSHAFEFHHPVRNRNIVVAYGQSRRTSPSPPDPVEQSIFVATWDPAEAAVPALLQSPFANLRVFASPRLLIFASPRLLVFTDLI
ncbi:uncharacterized protein DS421_1g17060 [Arachis hypogaea]|nr:uncharacterized protein DS421_1g17060 [Arachis hypogaea]